MKQLVIIILSILLLSACRNREHVQFEKLQHIDSIAEINADSAVAMIKIINRDTLLGNDNKYYFDLLEIRSNDKAYIAHTSDSAILSVINYFENHDFNDLLPVAYYYGGRVYSDLGDAPQALEYFHKALDCPNINSHTMAVAYAQIAGIYNEQKVFDLAESAYKKAIEVNRKNNNTVGALYGLTGLATNYFKQEKYDSALIVFNQCLKRTEEIGHTKLITSIKQTMAEVYIFKKEYQKALSIINSVKHQFNREDSASTMNTLAHLYYRLGEYDSTIYYSNKLIKCQSPRSRRNGYNILANLHMHNNQTKDAYDAIVMSTRLSDSIRKINTPYEIRQLSAIYNYQIRERENNKLKQKAQKHSLYLYITISGICILVLLLFIFHQQSRQKIHKKQQLIDNYAETILELRDSINSNASSHSVIINELFEGRFSILNDIGNTFADLSGSITDQKLLYKEVKEIISRFENPKTLTELEEIINRYKNNLMQKFRDDFPSLSNDEYQQVCYHYAGFSPKFISLLMHQKFPTIYKRRTRIKEKSWLLIQPTKRN